MFKHKPASAPCTCLRFLHESYIKSRLLGFNPMVDNVNNLMLTALVFGGNTYILEPLVSYANQCNVIKYRPILAFARRVREYKALVSLVETMYILK